MRFQTHVAGGLLVAALAIRVLPPPSSFLVASGALFGAVAPDSDISNPASHLSHLTRRASRRVPFAAFFRVLMILYAAMGTVLVLVSRLCSWKHRGETHSPLWGLALIILGMIGSLFGDGFLFAVGVGLGWLVHLVLDSLTPHGIRWLAINIRGPITTGGITDRAVGIVLFIVSLGVLLTF